MQKDRAKFRANWVTQKRNKEREEEGEKKRRKGKRKWTRSIAKSKNFTFRLYKVYRLYKETDGCHILS